MGENPDHEREEVPGRPAVSPENMRQQAEEGREQRAEEGRGYSHEAAPVRPASVRALVKHAGEVAQLSRRVR